MCTGAASSSLRPRMSLNARTLGASSPLRQAAARQRQEGRAGRASAAGSEVPARFRQLQLPASTPLPVHHACTAPIDSCAAAQSIMHRSISHAPAPPLSALT